MPFTLAHPIFVLPIARTARKLPLSALVIGSMTPDLPLFLPFLGMKYETNHSIFGVCTIDLAAGILIYLAFHGLVKFPLLTLLPAADARRLLPVAQATRLSRSGGDVLLILVGLVLGGLSHIWVDDFTHGYGWPVYHFAFLRLHLPILGFPIYKALQYSFSVLGLLGLGWAYIRWTRSGPAIATESEYDAALQPIPSRRFALCGIAASVLVALVFGIWFTVFWRHTLLPPVKFRKLVANLCVGSAPILTLSLLMYTLVWMRRHRRLAGGRDDGETSAAMPARD